MISLITSAQIHDGDAYTIAHTPISSANLMERASEAFVSAFVNHYHDKKTSIAVYCGIGNNGGDGLAIARILKHRGYEVVKIIITRFSEKPTADFDTNLGRAKETGLDIKEINKGDAFPDEDSIIIIDALLGSGLNKPLTDDYKNIVEHLNSLDRTVVAVDVPTGLLTEGVILKDTIAIKASLVITFQQPKINFLLPDSAPFIKKWEFVNIGINEEYLQSLNSPYQFIVEDDVRKMLGPRHNFSNKGTYGHALMVAGKPETMGAALLSSTACVYAGAGLTTACVPENGLIALNSYMAEVMAVVRQEGQLPKIKWESYNAVGIGPGLGKADDAKQLLTDVCKNFDKPIVIDADALNLLAEHPELWANIPGNSIITPHMKEFDRLFGEHQDWWQRIQTGIQKAGEHNINILLKNDYTIIITPKGKVYFNSTSNQAMATGGMGDILTGIITSLVAQKYLPDEACIMGAFIHGKAGDELALPGVLNVVLPSQVARQIPVTMSKLIA